MGQTETGRYLIVFFVYKTTGETLVRLLPSSKLAIPALLKQCVLLCYNTGRRHMMTTPLLELEGTWAEITAQIPDFAGLKLRVLVYPADETSTAAPDTRPIAEVLAEIAATIPAAELARLPSDFTDQLDHYIYGTPKR
jgi:hypothetical protein